MTHRIETEIFLEGIEFFSYHGYYPEEQKMGNNFAVDVMIKTSLLSSELSDLDKTINYEIIYAIVEKEMAITSALLETVAGRILEKIFTQIKQAEKAEVSISKFNPPIQGKCRRARVVLKRSR